MERRSIVGPATEDDHVPIADGRRRVEVAPRSRTSENRNRGPRHCREAKTVVFKFVIVCIQVFCFRISKRGKRFFLVFVSFTVVLSSLSSSPMNFIRESVFILFVSTKDEHRVLDHAGRVSVSGAGRHSSHFRSSPRPRNRIEAKQLITGASSIVASAPNVGFILPGDARVAVSLIRNRPLPLQNFVANRQHYAPSIPEGKIVGIKFKS